VAVAPPYVARRLRRAVGLPERDGVLVRAIEESSAAARAGIQRGDLIVEAGGRPVDGVDALHEALSAAERPGTLALTLLRGAEELRVEATFDSAPTTTEV
jgi:S1-C subfamily serine protease